MIFNIRNKVPVTELLAGLAEEASELAQAALKYRRTLTNDSPTPVSEDEAYDKLLEEIADVSLYTDTLYINRTAIDLIKKAKLQRWINRLNL